MRAWLQRIQPWILLTTCGLLLSGALAAGLLRKSLGLWPDNRAWIPRAVADQDQGGKSYSSGLHRDGVLLGTTFVLSDAPNRYGGLVFNPVDDQLQDYSGTTTLVLEYKTLTEDPMRVQILLDAAGRTRTGAELTRRFLFWELPPSLSWRKLEVPLSEFQTPEWWYRQNFVPPNRLPAPDFSRFLGLAVCESEFTPPWKTQGVELKSVRLEGPWWPCFLLLASSLLPLSLWWMRRRWQGWEVERPYLEMQVVHVPEALDEAATPSRIKPFGKPLAIQDREEQDFQKIVDFIAEQYSDPELALARVNRETGIPESRISAVLEKRTGLHFKPYLNHVRVDEAARLLLQTSQTVGEIAFQVGYANTTHFNRVFKSLKDVSPGEFRKTGGTKSENA